MNKLFKKLSILIVGIIMVLSVCSQAMAVEGFTQMFSYYTATAGEALEIGDVVFIYSSDGEVYKADADATGEYPACGIVGTIAADGADVMVVTSGILDGQTSSTSGQRIFLSTTAGGIDSDGSYAMTGDELQCLGYVMPGASGASTRFYIDIDPSPEP